jgi:hypothetical protein
MADTYEIFSFERGKVVRVKKGTKSFGKVYVLNWKLSVDFLRQVTKPWNVQDSL